MINIRKLLFIILIILSSQSFAEWTKVIVSPGGNTWYVDFDRIRKDGDYVYYWELNDKPKKDKFGNMSAINYKQVDCQLLAFKFLSDKYFTKPMGQGSTSAAF